MNKQQIISVLAGIGRVESTTINDSKIECRVYVPGGDNAFNDRSLSQLPCVNDTRKAIRAQLGSLIAGDRIVARLYHGNDIKRATVVFQCKVTY